MNTEGAARRDSGMKRAAGNPKNAAALDAAYQALEVLIKTTPYFTSSDVIARVENQGIVADKWQCIGSLIRKAAKDGRIRQTALAQSSRASRHCGDQKVWQSIEFTSNN